MDTNEISIRLERYRTKEPDERRCPDCRGKLVIGTMCKDCDEVTEVETEVCFECGSDNVAEANVCPFCGYFEEA